MELTNSYAPDSEYKALAKHVNQMAERIDSAMVANHSTKESQANATWAALGNQVASEAGATMLNVANKFAGWNNDLDIRFQNAMDELDSIGATGQTPLSLSAALLQDLFNKETSTVAAYNTIISNYIAALDAEIASEGNMSGFTSSFTEAL